jgi:hypothetical protein
MDANLGVLQKGLWIAFQAHQSWLVKFARAIEAQARAAALEEAAQIPRTYALELADGVFGQRFPEEVTAICNASTNMGERIRTLIAAPADNQGSYAGDSIERVLSDMRQAAAAAHTNGNQSVSMFVSQWVGRLSALLAASESKPASAGHQDALWSYDMSPPQGFIEYVAKNYSGEVVFHNPEWHALRLWNAAMKNAKPPAVSAAQPIPDHVIRETVNQLRDIAIKYHAAQQLREQIAHVIVPLLKPAPAAPGQPGSAYP